MFQTLQPLVLASASPRRRELLRSVGVHFEVLPSHIAENFGPSQEAPEDIVRRWAEEKALAVAESRTHHWILAADTIVVLEGEIFGKPTDPCEAVSMLKRLSSRTHEVITGMCLLHPDGGVAQLGRVRTRVHFKSVSEAEILAYVHTGEPLDKAGAYGIQGIGAFLVEWVNGSYTNVVGLPLCETLKWLLYHGVIAPVQPQDLQNRRSSP